MEVIFIYLFCCHSYPVPILVTLVTSVLLSSASMSALETKLQCQMGHRHDCSRLDLKSSVGLPKDCSRQISNGSCGNTFPSPRVILLRHCSCHVSTNHLHQDLSLLQMVEEGYVKPHKKQEAHTRHVTAGLRSLFEHFETNRHLRTHTHSLSLSVGIPIKAAYTQLDLFI